MQLLLVLQDVLFVLAPPRVAKLKQQVPEVQKLLLTVIRI